MNLPELVKEQLKLAPRIQLQDTITTPKTIGAVECVATGDSVVAVVVVCSFPTFEVIEKASYVLPNALPYRQGFVAYREMPAIIEAYNKLEQEPEVLLLKGSGVNHPRGFGIASHVGLVLQKPTIGITEKVEYGTVEKGKIQHKGEILGFEIKTREHAKPIYAAPGNLITLGNVLHLVPKMIHFPHKMPEPLHIVHKMARKRAKKLAPLEVVP